MAIHHQFPSEQTVETEDNTQLDSLGGAMGIHKKVADWYEEMMTGEDNYRSNVVFLEVKMRELLGEAWPQGSSDPDVVRASVCCDMLGRLIEASPGIKELGLRLLDELIVSIFQPRLQQVKVGKEQSKIDKEGATHEGAPPHDENHHFADARPKTATCATRLCLHVCFNVCARACVLILLCVHILLCVCAHMCAYCAQHMCAYCVCARVRAQVLVCERICAHAHVC